MDVILSARLFDHLFKLPLRYFEVRRVGDTIARIREVENIRRFLTGTPITSIFITPLFKTQLEEKFRTGADMQRFLVETVSGVQTIKSFALVPFTLRDGKTRWQNMWMPSFKTSIISGISGFVCEEHGASAGL